MLNFIYFLINNLSVLIPNIDDVFVCYTETMCNMSSIYFVPCCWFKVPKLVVEQPCKRIVILMENDGFLSDKVYAFVQLNLNNIRH